MGFTEMQERFTGYRNTPFLWKDTLNRLSMYGFSNNILTKFPEINPEAHIRLGKLIEQFVLFEFEQNPNVELLKSNLQIFKGQITIGELDALIQQLNTFIHLEIVYKFYLYDPSISDELSRWIGPNRNDSLVHKMDKLKNKQLPLLYHPETAKVLAKLDISPEDFTQQLHFKAQLFVPYSLRRPEYPLVNNACINGFYVRYTELSLFTDHAFFIPEKLDWLSAPQNQVDWMTIDPFKTALTPLLNAQRAPLCWMKSKDGEMHVFFVVWWK